MGKISTEAYLLVQKGNAHKAFNKRTIEIQGPAEGEVLIEVEAFGLNYADVAARKGLYREAPPLPCVLGYEVVGVIKEVGKSVSEKWIEKRVVGFCRFGGYAKRVVTKETAIVEIPSTLPFSEALALCTQSVTAYYMMEYLAPVHRGDVVLIHSAAGGVGTLLVQLAKLKGAVVIAKIGADTKSELVKSLGADHVVNYRSVHYKKKVREILKEKSLDVSYNPVGGSTFKTDFSMLGSGGRLVLFGGAELTNTHWGFLSSLNFVWKMGLIIPIGLMIRSKSILGVNMLKIADHKPEVLQHCLKKVLDLFLSGELIPQIGGVYPSSEIATAHEALEKGGTTGKLALFWT
jgi:NADPH:quinone reductase-like Zn-dependent oxidoreductase